MNTNATGKLPLGWLVTLSLTAMLLGTLPAFAAETNTAATAVPQPRAITDTMSCAACGMYPHRYPKWQAQVIFTDGTMAPFDGGKCLFRFLFNIPKFAPGHTPEQVAAVWVRDFNSGKWIDGKAAHYVVGSKEMGPMGKELIPFASRASAEEFRKANGGTIDTFANISMATIKPLMGKMH